MNATETRSAGTTTAANDVSTTEAELGKVLALIHRVLTRIDDVTRTAEVQSILSKAAACLEAARLAHAGDSAARNGAATQLQKVATGVDAEIAAVIAAAIAVLFDQPYRLVSVQPVATPVPYLNVWALEGRTQIFQSHKIR
jgi:hypothetical protein